MSAFFAAARERLPKGQDLIVLVVIWTLLVSVPFWLPFLGGYTALASKVLVFGLAAMGLNILLGFTGVLSFGHAAYFGLGAYGAGLTLRYLVHSTPLAMASISPCARSPSANSGITSPIAGTISPAASMACAISIASRSASAGSPSISPMARPGSISFCW
jgi:ABC-type branched-subunit amino acid transport system permease subunit